MAYTPCRTLLHERDPAPSTLGSRRFCPSNPLSKVYFHFSMPRGGFRTMENWEFRAISNRQLKGAGEALKNQIEVCCELKAHVMDAIWDTFSTCSCTNMAPRKSTRLTAKAEAAATAAMQKEELVRQLYPLPNECHDRQQRRRKVLGHQRNGRFLTRRTNWTTMRSQISQTIVWIRNL